MIKFDELDKINARKFAAIKYLRHKLKLKQELIPSHEAPKELHGKIYTKKLFRYSLYDGKQKVDELFSSYLWKSMPTEEFFKSLHLKQY